MSISLNDYKEIHQLCTTIEEGYNYYKEKGDDGVFMLSDIVAAIETVNGKLFGCNILNRNFSVEEWISIMLPFLDAQVKRKNRIDRDFYWIMEYTRLVSRQLIIERVKYVLLSQSADLVSKYERYYQTYEYFWGNLNVRANDFAVIERRVAVLIEHGEDLIWLYERLGDYRSKNVLLCTLENWITFDPNQIVKMKEGNFADYWDLDLLELSDNEVIVDLGAYTGDSLLDFINEIGHYKSAYCYEITDASAQAMMKNFEKIEHVHIRQKAVSDSNGITYMKDTDEMDSGNGIGYSKGKPIETVTLDEDIVCPISLIKMDIEGSEQKAIRGANGHIASDKPKLLISVYHGNDDIYQIPRLIDSIRDDYKFYLRSNGGQWGPSEIVLYAL